MPVQIALDMRFQDELEYMLQERVPPSFDLFFKSVMYDNFAVPRSGVDEPDVILEPTPTPTPIPTPTPTPVFTDLEEHQWAKPHIESLFYQGIISGYSDKTFQPQNYITRAEAAKLAAISFLDLSYRNEASSFSDISDADWFYPYVLSGEYFSLYQNIYEYEFKPDEYITRQELCAVVYRAVRRKNLLLPKVKNAYLFYDFQQISNYAYDPIRELQVAGVIDGVGDNCFAPNHLATRAEVAKIIDLLIHINS